MPKTQSAVGSRLHLPCIDPTLPYLFLFQWFRTPSTIIKLDELKQRTLHPALALGVLASCNTSDLAT